MKIISWNVAGMRSCFAKGLENFVINENADIYCFQETKVQPEQVPMHIVGYSEFLYPAEKKGYSGVMVYSRIQPLNVAYGTGVREFDSEGRVVTLEFEKFFLVTCYAPNSKRELERLASRMEYEDVMLSRLKELSQKKHVIYCGDMNVAHEEIDIKNPKTNRFSAGFTDEEREQIIPSRSEGFIFYNVPNEEGIYSYRERETEDCIFVLSYTEIWEYFKIVRYLDNHEGDPAVLCSPTEYVKNNCDIKIYTQGDNDYCGWWLGGGIWAGGDPDTVWPLMITEFSTSSRVSPEEIVYSGVRPAMWITWQEE